MADQCQGYEMEQIGFSLVNLELKTEVEYWGDTPNQLRDLPEIVILPTGDHILAPKSGVEYDGFMLVPRYFNPSENSSIVFSNNSIIVNRPVQVNRGPTLEDLQQQLANIAAQIAILSADKNN